MPMAPSTRPVWRRRTPASVPRPARRRTDPCRCNCGCSSNGEITFGHSFRRGTYMKYWKVGALAAGYLFFTMSLIYSQEPPRKVDWPVYGGDAGHSLYSPLKQI